MVKKVAIFTTTRAEFGILLPLIREMRANEELVPLVFVGGSHLCLEHGETIKEIKARSVEIAGTFDYVLNGNDSFSLAKSLGIGGYELAHIFKNNDFDFVCVVGDRFELLSIAANAILFKKPIIHIHGGEKTEGVIDEQVRHMITKAAHLHFTACREYAENVRRMGEAAWRVHNTGALSIDNIAGTSLVEKTCLFTELGLDVGRKTVLMTYHPVTLEFTVSVEEQICNIFRAMEPYDLQVVVTAPNIEVGRDEIVSIIKDEVGKNPNMFYFDSLGTERFHSMIPNCEFVIGNSSSGILEVPFFKVPTVNIGDRQNGRIRHDSVIDTDYSVEGIRAGIDRALSEEFRSELKEMPFKFGDGHAAERMVEVIKQVTIDQDFMRKRIEFPDYEYEQSIYNCRSRC